jgi:hypothetical protein
MPERLARGIPSRSQDHRLRPRLDSSCRRAIHRGSNKMHQDHTPHRAYQCSRRPPPRCSRTAGYDTTGTVMLSIVRDRYSGMRLRERLSLGRCRCR